MNNMSHQEYHSEIKLSDCCGAFALGETHDNSEELDTEIGICCMCREHATFYYDSSPLTKYKEKGNE